MKLRPSTIQAFRKSGYVSINDAQLSILTALIDSTDVVFQGRGATGKTSTIGVLLSERYLGEGVYFSVVPSLVLKNELLLSLGRFLSLAGVEVLDVAEARHFSSRTVVLVGLPKEFLMAKGIMGTRNPKLIVMDEADELFEYPSDISMLLKQYLCPSTKTLFLSATFPPYIMTRIEEALVMADETRTDEPTRIHHCVSTSTCASKNPVRLNVDYFYTVLCAGETVPDRVYTILTNHKHRKALVMNCTANEGEAILCSLSPSEAYLVKSEVSDISSINQTCLVDPKGLLSRGVNINGLDLGISVGIHESKETILHQWARVGRKPDSSIRPKFFMILSDVSEIDQLRFLEFQLGVRFQEYNPRDIHHIAPTHPFHVHKGTEERLRAVAALIAS